VLRGPSAIAELLVSEAMMVNVTSTYSAWPQRAVQAELPCVAELLSQLVCHLAAFSVNIE